MLSRPERLPVAASAWRRWLSLGIVLSGTFVFVLDFFVVNVALPSIQRTLGAGPDAVEWIVAGYGLATGVGHAHDGQDLGSHQRGAQAQVCWPPPSPPGRSELREKSSNGSILPPWP